MSLTPTMLMRLRDVAITLLCRLKDGCSTIRVESCKFSFPVIGVAEKAPNSINCNRRSAKTLYGAHQPRFYCAECREAGYACATAAVGGADVQFAVRAHVRDGAQGFVAAVAGVGVKSGVCAIAV
jgi:hypothetical protein